MEKEIQGDKMSKNYIEIETTIGELKDGDQIYCTNGEWKEINEILPLHVPDNMYRLHFKNKNNSGYVDCSGDHEWSIYIGGRNKQETVISSDLIYNVNIPSNSRFGSLNGPKLKKIERITPYLSRCISVNNEDHLFEIIDSNGNKIFTHNCMNRLVCGQLGSVASRMALDNNTATAIDGSRKGAGIIRSQGDVAHIQYYFEEPTWWEKWCEDRGLTRFGYAPGEDPNAPLDPNLIDLGEDEELSLPRDKTKIEFHKTIKEIDKTKDQKFEEI